MNRPTARRPASGRAARGTAATRADDWEQAGRGRAARERRAGQDPRGTASGADQKDAKGARVSARRATGRADGEPARRRASRAGADPDPARRGRRPRRPGAGDPPAAAQGTADKPRRRRLTFRRAPRPPAAQVPAHYRRRRLVAGLAMAFALLAAVGAGSWVLLYDAGVANVRDVEITGLSTVPEQAVRDAVAVAPGGPLIRVDTTGIAQRVAALQGVASVQVRRAWPHTVEVVVTERVPVALWQNAQGTFEVDGTGLPFRRAPQPPPVLPRLAFAGVAPEDPSTAAALTVLHDLPDALRMQVTTVEVAGTQVTLGLGPEKSVRWGDPDRSADKIAVLGPLLGQPGTVYDVSSPDLPTVRR